MKYDCYKQGISEAFEIDLNDPIETANKEKDIDEYIAYCRDIDLKIRADIFGEIGDLLEELKAYRANEGMSENVYKAGYRFGYKKAIDEYTEYLKEIGKTGTDCWVPCFTPNSWKDDFLTKQNKRGKQNEDIHKR